MADASNQVNDRQEGKKLRSRSHLIAQRGQSCNVFGPSIARPGPLSKRRNQMDKDRALSFVTILSGRRVCPRPAMYTVGFIPMMLLETDDWEQNAVQHAATVNRRTVGIVRLGCILIIGQDFYGHVIRTDGKLILHGGASRSANAYT